MNWKRRSLATALAISAVGGACTGGTEPTATNVFTPGPPVGLSISPTALSLVVNDAARLSVRAVDASGREVRVPFSWTSADPTIAMVRGSDGTVTAISAGATTITATAGTLNATATVLVRPPDPPVRIALSTVGLNLLPGRVARLTARAYDSTGRMTNVAFEWSSADPAVATVGLTDGVVTAIAVGSTTVIVSAGAVRGTATVSVMTFPSAFSFTRGTQSTPGGVTYDVLSYSATDGTTRSLQRPAQFRSIAAAAWSADGERLAVEVVHGYFTQPGDYCCDHNSDLYVVDRASPLDSPWRALTTDGLSKSPRWSPDGTRIAFLRQDALFAERNDVYTVDAGGGAPVRVTRIPGWYSSPSWSPDGRRLAFSAYLDGYGHSQMFTVNSDGSGLTGLLTGASAYDPSWSPDGSRIAYAGFRVLGPGSYQSDLNVVDADGRNERRVVSLGSYVSAPAWSPDGRQILFASDPGLHLVNADGSGLLQVTIPPPLSWDSAPSWRR